MTSVRLVLMAGPMVPVPAPKMVIDAVESVEVRSSSSGASGFQISLAIDRRSPLNDFFLIAAGNSASTVTPPLRVIIAVVMGGAPVPLFDGIMTRADVSTGRSGGSIAITGEDLTAMMDRIDFSGLPYPAMPVPARVALICAKYAVFGIVPLAIPPIALDVPIPIERTPAHRGTDLAYLRELASEAGYVFYIEPGPVLGTNVAYFGPELKIGVPQRALNVEMDALTNVEDIELSFDPTKGKLPVVLVQNQMTRVPIPIPIPNINPLQPPLALLPTSIANIELMKNTASMSVPDAINAGLAVAARSQDSAEAKGTLDVLRYGRPLKARGLVGLRGVGIAYDGLWFVDETTTTLKRGEFKQRFKLTRNGLISTVPRVAA